MAQLFSQRRNSPRKIIKKKPKVSSLKGPLFFLEYEAIRLFKIKDFLSKNSDFLKSEDEYNLIQKEQIKKTETLRQSIADHLGQKDSILFKNIENLFKNHFSSK